MRQFVKWAIDEDKEIDADGGFSGTLVPSYNGKALKLNLPPRRNGDNDNGERPEPEDGDDEEEEEEETADSEKKKKKTSTKKKAAAVPITAVFTEAESALQRHVTKNRWVSEVTNAQTKAWGRLQRVNEWSDIPHLLSWWTIAAFLHNRFHLRMKVQED